MKLTDAQKLIIHNAVYNEIENFQEKNKCLIVNKIIWALEESTTWPQQQKKPNRVVESMTKIITPWHDIRIWRSFENGPITDNGWVAKQIKNHVEDNRKVLSMEDVGLYIESFALIAAYEILDKDGNGIVVYPDWC